MLSLPNLAPRDSYSLWYTSSHNSNPTVHHDSSINPSDPQAPNQTQPSHPSQRRHHHAMHRHPLARLRLDEEYIERRKQNVQNYGNSWIKPPGISKSLYQLREEKREMEEHQEALRREALAQELAEAEAAEGVDALLGGEGLDAEEGMGEGEERDLDDDVPEAETTVLEGDGDEDEDAEEDDDQDDSADEDLEQEDVPRGVLASRVPDDVYREALARGEEIGAPRFGDEGNSTVDDEDNSHMLQEEDLVQETELQGDPDEDMDMDADLDDDIPEAGGYEHTDTEDELSSSDDDDESLNTGVLPRGFPPGSSMVRSDGTQNSMDLSSMLSNGSSQVGSSPHQISGPRRRGG
ncbi:Uncharacterized protein BP5553_02620 [Venustampulla echinocandica]|uniref:Uncharacterized protein n=1 Tax=Venustampulla echinocandica TaxID=2656787 RepID=A0A370TRX5_9HELO|nr:Uncharacterized protein BP5553_02620 [Venustampulla echinocandica]RDL38280.1 Uncharacterized protein BP5553_02620 [Venustampulla echinocandica]